MNLETKVDYFKYINEFVSDITDRQYSKNWALSFMIHINKEIINYKEIVEELKLFTEESKPSMFNFFRDETVNKKHITIAFGRYCEPKNLIIVALCLYKKFGIIRFCPSQLNDHCIIIGFNWNSIFELTNDDGQNQLYVENYKSYLIESKNKHFAPNFLTMKQLFTELINPFSTFTIQNLIELSYSTPNYDSKSGVINLRIPTIEEDEEHVASLKEYDDWLIELEISEQTDKEYYENMNKFDEYDEDDYSFDDNENTPYSPDIDDVEEIDFDDYECPACGAIGEGLCCNYQINRI